jgi:hypothetical protein
MRGPSTDRDADIFNFFGCRGAAHLVLASAYGLLPFLSASLRPTIGLYMATLLAIEAFDILLLVLGIGGVFLVLDRSPLRVVRTTHNFDNDFRSECPLGNVGAGVNDSECGTIRGGEGEKQQVGVFFIVNGLAQFSKLLTEIGELPEMGVNVFALATPLVPKPPVHVYRYRFGPLLIYLRHGLPYVLGVFAPLDGVEGGVRDGISYEQLHRPFFPISASWAVKAMNSFQGRVP